VSKLLHVEASPRKVRSASIRVAREFLESYAEAHPDHEIEQIDLWDVSLPEFDGDTIQARYRILHDQEHSTAEAHAWNRVVRVFRRFAAADRYLFSTPMWNFGVPYKLKHFIDVVSQPGLAFQATEEGFEGLVTGKPTMVIYARGGEYAGDWAALDFQKPYLEALLRFIGFEEIHSITVDPTLGDPEVVEGAKISAVERAREIARTL
jgi:FMN-dependent NADH-azoreductase